MKRKIMMILALAVCISMTACGDAKNDESKAEKSADTAVKTTVISDESSEAENTEDENSEEKIKAEELDDTAVTTTVVSDESSAVEKTEEEDVAETKLGPKLVTLTFPDGKTIDINVGTNAAMLVEEAGLKPISTCKGFCAQHTSYNFFGFIPYDGTDDNDIKDNETVIYLLYKDKEGNYVNAFANILPEDWTICGVSIERFNENSFENKNLITYSPDSIAVDYDGIELGKTDYFDIVNKGYEMPFDTPPFATSIAWQDNDVCFTAEYNDESSAFGTDPADTTIDEFTIISADCIEVFDGLKY